MENKTVNLLIGCTGSVATIKLPVLIEQLQVCNGIKFNIQVVCTERAKHFFGPNSIKPEITILTDQDEWDTWKGRGDAVIHIDLGKWADLMIIAPLDANSLAKIATGVCDNLLLCTLRAWDFSKPLLFCPAMNTRMWDHPLTEQHIQILKRWGFIEVPCVSKKLMCGDIGNGAMAEVETIVRYVEDTVKMNIFK